MYKPVILIGNGVRNSKIVVEHLLSLNIPVLTTWMAMDLVPENSPVFCGRPGIIGQRAANIINQKADALFCFGVRLDAGQIAYNYDNYAPGAKKYVFDTDQAELDKLPQTWKKYKIDFSQPLIEQGFFGAIYDLIPLYPNNEWLTWSKNLYNRFRPELDSIETKKDFIDPFKFINELSDLCTEDDVISPGSSGQAAEIFMQTFKVKKGQRVTCVSTIGAMGADIPMAIGACLASGKKRTICVTGDGGFMVNIHELEVVRRLNLPIKFFILNNRGYGSVRVMQTSRFGNKVGCDKESGFTTPELFSVSESYGISYNSPYRGQIFDNHYIRRSFTNLVTPMIFELFIDPDFKQFPKVLSPNMKIDSLEDMTPKIPDLQELMEWGNV